MYRNKKKYFFLFICKDTSFKIPASDQPAISKQKSSLKVALL